MGASRYPGNHHGIFRKTYQDLKKTTMVTFFRLLEESGADRLIQSWHKVDGLLTWKFRDRNGKPSVTHFMGLDDKHKLKSLELGSVYVCELPELRPEDYLFLEGRLSSPYGPRRLWCEGNPEGKDQVMWSHYHPDGPDYQPTRECFHVTSLENPYNPKDYIESLMAKPDWWKDRFVYGKFVVFEGLIYPSFKKEIHVIEPFVVDPAWQITRVIDFGMSHNPTTCLWFASDFEGNHYLIKEAAWKGKLIEEVAEGIHARSSGMNIWRTYCDPSMFKMDQQNQITKAYCKVSDLFHNENISLYPANNDMRTRFDRTNTMMFLNPRKQNPVTGESGSPDIFFFGTCERTIHEITQRQWDGKTGTERPKEGIPDDHVDCVEYFCNTEPRATDKPIVRDKWAPAPENPWENWVVNV